MRLLVGHCHLLWEEISGPLWDRIVIHEEIPRAEYEKLAGDVSLETSERIRALVKGARERQCQRFTGTRLVCNAEMVPEEVTEYC